ncbi:hypothetical protein LZ554_009581 [Drepanopeziza brunnea f. sp. 'monogermtubi']|nr:hypothetical protein LZ554_009581 [Drepanopeziza brunnea f. sp. 'monogermtubi']
MSGMKGSQSVAKLVSELRPSDLTDAKSVEKKKNLAPSRRHRHARNKVVERLEALAVVRENQREYVVLDLLLVNREHSLSLFKVMNGKRETAKLNDLVNGYSPWFDHVPHDACNDAEALRSVVMTAFPDHRMACYTISITCSEFMNRTGLAAYSSAPVLPVGQSRIDFFGNGSLWIVQAPGHMPGNLCTMAYVDGD